MPEEKRSASCCDGADLTQSRFQVEAVISVDERGQMVLPKDVRAKAGLRPGDKLALISWEKDGEICCFSLVKTEALTGMVKSFLGPMMDEIAAR